MDQTIIKAKRTAKKANGDTLVLPLISPTGKMLIKYPKTTLHFIRNKELLALPLMVL